MAAAKKIVATFFDGGAQKEGASTLFVISGNENQKD